jgi:UDP-N-acetylglucosamine 4,6-dehydratase/5-epimerase
MINQRVLIIGGTGSLGKKLIDRLSQNNQVGVYSRDEMKQWTCKNALKGNYAIQQPEFFVGDIRDFDRVKEIIVRFAPDHVIVAAALKQVDTCELSPVESVKTNLVGTQNVVRAVDELTHSTHKIKSVLFVSTDKACSPVNVYGMCKATSERLVTSMSKAHEDNTDATKYLCTRYGNVLESRGSIIPLFKYQSENAKCLTVTDPNMTRFVMTLDDSVDLILTTIKEGKSGETWIPRIPAMRIGDIAELFSERSNKPIEIIGLRPGEKQHEDLINKSESARTTKHKKTHYVIGPAYEPGSGPTFKYTSADDVMTKQQLREHLTKLGVFELTLSQFQGQSIEEIRT